MADKSLDAVRQFIDTSPDAILVVDAAGEIRLANGLAREMFGVDSFESLTVEQLMPATFAAGHAELRRKFAADPSPRVMGAGRELEALHANGQPFPVDISLGVVDGTGEQMVSVVVRDISERRDAERRAAMHQFLVETTREALVTVDGDGVVTSWNSAAQRLTGRSAADALGSQISEQLMLAEDRLRARLADAARGADIIENARTTILRSDGSHTNAVLSMTPLRDASGKPAGAAAMIRDITEQVEMQSILAEVQARMADTQRLAKIGLWVWDARSDEVQWSEQLYELTGIDPLDFAGTLETHLEVIASEHREAVERAMRDAWANETEFQIECALTSPAGGQRWVELSAKPERNTTGESIGLSGICQDLTDRHEAVEALRRADALKDEFLGTVSHELRTPLTTIIGFGELLHNQVGADLQMMTEVIRRNASEVNAMVERILEFTRAQSGRFNLDYGEHDLSSLLDDLRPLVEHSLAKHELIMVDAPDVTLHVDDDAFRRILINLMTNAAKFAPEGTAITVRPTVVGDLCQIAVIDEGPGVPPEATEAIFDRFFQVSTNMVAAKRGAGVGLSIVQTYAEAMGGHAWVESELGKGATFTVELPIVQKARRSR